MTRRYEELARDRDDEASRQRSAEQQEARENRAFFRSTYSDDQHDEEPAPAPAKDEPWPAEPYILTHDATFLTGPAAAAYIAKMNARTQREAAAARRAIAQARQNDLTSQAQEPERWRTWEEVS